MLPSIYVDDLIQQHSKDIPLKDIRLILQKILAIPDSDWISSKERPITETEQAMFEHIMMRRQKGEPVARIFQEWEFWGLSFYLSNDTLVPRPDTETIIEAVLKNTNATQAYNILDLGTGSGCILISLLTELTESFGIGIDLSKDALKTARRNAVFHNIFKRCEFLYADWSSPLQGHFDIIVSNPPYIETSVIESLSPEVRDFDPILALDGGEDGLDSIKILLEKIKPCVSEKTLIFFEIGYNQADRVMKLIDKFGFSTRAVHNDLQGHQRVIEFAYGDKK